MGMAASQARFLSLTARKTNTEYEGQQINQQRTALSNKTANYYNDLLGMSVPVPPAVDNYTKTVYSFQDGALANTISTMIANNDGTYTVSYTSSWTDDFAAVGAASSIITRTGTEGNYSYFVGEKELRELGTGITENGGVYTYTGNDAYLKTLSSDQLKETLEQEKAYEAVLDKQYGDATWVTRYVQNTSTGTWQPYFYKQEVLGSATYDTYNNSKSNIPAYTIGSAKKTEEIKGVEAKIEQDATGRLINITLRPGEADEATYALTTNTVTDQAAYEDAMNQYEYDKAQYDNAIQEINAKIEIIQAEDKDLELRLKQLDTEQDAISNEIDAVQKVIEKNVESSFKTFG